MKDELLKLSKPLGMSHPRLSHTDFGFTNEDLDKVVFVNDGRVEGITNNSSKSSWKLGELIAYLKEVYSGKIGYQYMHIHNKAERDWIRNKIENKE